MFVDSGVKQDYPVIEPILEKIKNMYGVDFTQYRRSTILRRIDRRLASTRCTDTAEYLELLNDNPEECLNLLGDLTIKFSEFYRDPPLWELLERDILPGMIQAKMESAGGCFRIWSAGCALGEEAYTAAMVTDRVVRSFSTSLDFSVTATDIDRRALERGQQGEYQQAVLSKLPESYLTEYFDSNGKVNTIIERLRDRVHFLYDNLLEPATDNDTLSRFDLVLCRNVLIYFTRPIQSAAFNRLSEAVNAGGVIILGTAEMPPLHWKPYFHELNHEYRILQMTGRP